MKLFNWFDMGQVATAKPLIQDKVDRKKKTKNKNNGLGLVLLGIVTDPGNKS